MVQTYAPDNYAISAGARQDYALFYGQEIEMRRGHNQPPFSRLISLVYSHVNAEACRRGAEKLCRQLKAKKEWEGSRTDIVGPAPMFFGRVRGRYKWQIILRGSVPSTLLDGVSLGQGWTVNIDPMSLL